MSESLGFKPVLRIVPGGGKACQVEQTRINRDLPLGIVLIARNVLYRFGGWSESGDPVVQRFSSRGAVPVKQQPVGLRPLTYREFKGLYEHAMKRFINNPYSENLKRLTEFGIAYQQSYMPYLTSEEWGQGCPTATHPSAPDLSNIQPVEFDS